jgi:hypothetical protein
VYGRDVLSDTYVHKKSIHRKIDHARNLERCRLSVDHYAAPVFHDRDDNLFERQFRRR